MSRPGVLLLVRSAPTAATRAARFPGDEPLDPAGEQVAAALAGHLPTDRVVRSPAQRCAATASAAGHPQAEVVAELRGPDHGRWTGRRLADVAREEPAELARWQVDPDHAPPGGESRRQVAERTATALAALRTAGITTAAITHGTCIRAAVCAALEVPWSAFWHLDVAPGHLTELHTRPDGGWRVVRLNTPPVAIPATRTAVVPERA